MLQINYLAVCRNNKYVVYVLALKLSNHPAKFLEHRGEKSWSAQIDVGKSVVVCFCYVLDTENFGHLIVTSQRETMVNLHLPDVFRDSTKTVH